MSQARTELEDVQAQLKELEARMISDLQLQLLADQLDRDAASWEAQLDRNERRALKTDVSNTGARVMGFGFALLAVTPMVVMIGISLSRWLRHEFELAWVLLISGVLVITLTSLERTRRFVAHRVSGAWKLSRQAREAANALRALIRSA